MKNRIINTPLHVYSTVWHVYFQLFPTTILWISAPHTNIIGITLDGIITNLCFLLVWRIGEKDDNSYDSNSSRPHSPVPSSQSSHPPSHPTSSTPPSPIQQRSASLSSFSSSSSDEDIQVQDFNVFLIQGYPQRMKLQRRLYVIYFVHFRAFRVPCRHWLIYLLNHLVNHKNT